MLVPGTGANDGGINPARTRYGVRHGMEDPMAADSRLRALRSCAGGCFPSGNGSAPTRRPAAFDRDPSRSLAGLVLMLLCSPGAPPLATATVIFSALCPPQFR